MNALTPTTTAEPVMLSFLERAVSNPEFDVQKFEVVLRAMQEERAKQAERLFYGAMAEAQAEMEPVRRDTTNPQTRSKYARFEAIDAMLRPIYSKHGFSVSYRTGAPVAPGAVRVICKVAHAAGHNIEAELEAGLDNTGTGGKVNKVEVQAVGSTTSYLKRYLCTLVWNVALADNDDDGEGSRPQARPARPAYEPTSLRDMRPKPVPSRAEMDRTLDNDAIPDFDAPPPVDRAAVGVQALEAQIRAAASEDELHTIAGSPQVEKQRAYLAKYRPELNTLLADALGERYQQLVAARLEAEGQAAEAATA